MLQLRRKYEFKNRENGIDYIEGDPIAMQLIVNSELDENKNLWLKSLTDDLDDRALTEKLTKEYGKNKDNRFYASVMNVVVRANRGKFEEDKDMCDALREIFEDELNERERKGLEQGLEEGVWAMISFCQEMNITYENTLEQVMKKFELSRGQAEEKIKRYWNR